MKKKKKHVESKFIFCPHCAYATKHVKKTKWRLNLGRFFHRTKSGEGEYYFICMMCGNRVLDDVKSKD